MTTISLQKAVVTSVEAGVPDGPHESEIAASGASGTPPPTIKIKEIKCYNG